MKADFLEKFLFLQSFSKSLQTHYSSYKNNFNEKDFPVIPCDDIADDDFL